MDGGGGDTSIAYVFLYFWGKEKKIPSYLWGHGSHLDIPYPDIKKVVSCWRVPPLNGHHLHTHGHNHLHNFSIGAARGAENDPISTVRLRSLTWRLYIQISIPPFNQGISISYQQLYAPIKSKNFSAKGVGLVEYWFGFLVFTVKGLRERFGYITRQLK